LRRGLRESPHPPASLRVPGHYGEWQPWQPIPSTVTDDDIEWLQRRVSVPLPGAYLALLRHKHFLNLQVEPVRFFRFIPELWRESFEEEYSGWDPDAVLAARLIPFGHECMADAGPVCFDARVACAEADYPVVFWDHEWVGTE